MRARPSPPAGPEPAPGWLDLPSADVIRVFTAASIPEGHLVRGLLEAEGIPVLVKGGGEGPYRLGPVELWVPEGLAVQARLIVEEAARSLDRTDPAPTPDREDRS